MKKKKYERGNAYEKSVTELFSNDTDSGRDFGGNPGKAGALVTVPGLERILSAGIPGLLMTSSASKIFSSVW